MDRAYASGAAGTPPAAPASPSIGYPQAANPGLGAPATKPGPYWYHMITEEIRTVIAAAGLTPDQGDVTQLGDAISALIVAQAPQLPAGTVIHVSQVTAPTGYIKANGAAVSRTTYAALFAAIGTTFGVGDGSTTFNLPDLRGEFLRGLDDGRGIDTGRTIGSYQRGTLDSRDLDGTSSLAVNSGASPAEPGTNRNDVGLDVPVLSDYPGDPFATFGAIGSGQTLSSNTANFGVTRPRNVALLACVKY